MDTRELIYAVLLTVAFSTGMVVAHKLLEETPEEVSK